MRSAVIQLLCGLCLVGLVLGQSLTVKQTLDVAAITLNYAVDKSESYLYTMYGSTTEVSQIIKLDFNMNVVALEFFNVTYGFTIINDTTAIVFEANGPPENSTGFQIFMYDLTTLTQLDTVITVNTPVFVQKIFYLPSYSSSSILVLFSITENGGAYGIMQVEFTTGAVLNKYVFDVELGGISSFAIPSSNRIGFVSESIIYVFDTRTWDVAAQTGNLNITRWNAPVVAYESEQGAIVAFVQSKDETETNHDLVFYSLDDLVVVAQIALPVNYSFTGVTSDHQGTIYLSGLFMAGANITNFVLKCVFDGAEITSTNTLNLSNTLVAAIPLATYPQGIVHQGDWYTNNWNGYPISNDFRIVRIGDSK